MNSYTVLFLCARGYKCFREVFANSPAEAWARLQEIQHNLGAITEVRAN